MNNTLRITLIGLLAAWSVALSYLPSPPGTYLLKFTGFPLVLSGFIVGPAGGFWCGALADILGLLLRPSGPYIPVFTLTSALTGALPAWLYVALPGARNPQGRLRLRWFRLLLVFLVVQVGVKVLLVAPARALLFAHPWALLALQALMEQLVHAPLYAWGAWVVLRRVVLRPRAELRAQALDWEIPEPGLPPRPAPTP